MAKPSLTAQALARNGRAGVPKIRGAMAAEIAYKMFIEPRREALALFTSPAFGTLMTAFKAAAETGMLNHQEIKYAAAGTYPFNAEDFRKAFEAVMICAPAEPQKVVLENGFTNISKTHDGLIFRALSGDGPLYFIEKAEAKPA